jgi:tRNA threonylcarbamoyladenosine biosynthesis protein TsaB
MPLHLVLDTGSPLVSVAAARDGCILASRAVAMERSSSQLLSLIDDVLQETGARPSDLEGVAALRGPGSFTGLRIGLATAFGFHQALGVRATALDTLQVLAASPLPAARERKGVIVAAVDALRGEWSAQVFEIGGEGVPQALGEMSLVAGREMPALGGSSVIGFGVSRLAEVPGWPREIRLVEAGALAPTAARLLADASVVWDAALLTAPLYARPPAATLPRSRGSAAART